MTTLKIPFPFVLEYIDSLHPVVKSMFGCYAVYVADKIVLMLRKRDDFPHDNGVWLAVQPEFLSEIKDIFPSMRHVGLFGHVKTNWQVLPLEHRDFEEMVMRACDLILKHDPRIGKVPKTQKSKKR